MPPKDPGEVLAAGGLVDQTDAVVGIDRCNDPKRQRHEDQGTYNRTDTGGGGVIELVERMLAGKTDNHKLLHAAFTLQN